MKDKMKSVKLDITLSAVITMLIGLAFIVWSDQIAEIVVKIVAVALIVIAAIVVVSKLINPQGRIFGIIIAVLALALGIWMFAVPKTAASIIPLIIGIVMAVQGVQDIVVAIETAKNKGRRWWTSLLYGIITLAFAALCIAEPFTTISLGYKIIGVMLILDGLADVIVVGKVNKAKKDIIDVEIKSERDAEDYE